MADTWEDSWEDFDLGDKAASQIPGDSAESVDINGKGNGLAWDDEEEVHYVVIHRCFIRICRWITLNAFVWVGVP